jgi:CRP-like cAMP-binding protein
MTAALYQFNRKSQLFIRLYLLTQFRFQEAFNVYSKSVKARPDIFQPDRVGVGTSRKQAAPGELVLEQDTTGTEMYIVADGSVDVYVQSGDETRSLVVLGRGQVIGEMALIDQGHRSASVRAMKNGATLYLIESQKFFDLCNTNYRIGFIVMRNLAIDIAFKLRHRNLTIA